MFHVSKCSEDGRQVFGGPAVALAFFNSLSLFLWDLKTCLLFMTLGVVLPSGCIWSANIASG